jgi:predicted O-methyltransferase YrrM
MHLPWVYRSPAPGRPGISTSILEEESATLGELAAGQRVLEIGSAFGYSAICMALAGAKSIVAVDPHIWLQSIQPMRTALDNFAVADRVTIIQERSPHGLLGLRENYFGFIFIDGDHSYEGCSADITAALPLLAPGGVLAVHDYLEDCCCPGVRTAVDLAFTDAKGQQAMQDRIVGSMWVSRKLEVQRLESAGNRV